MPRVKIKTRPARDKPAAQAQQRNLVWLADATVFDSLAVDGYTSLSRNPEVSTGVNAIARLVGAMTIHLMRHTTIDSERGPVPVDVRVRNDLSNVVDIEPNRYMTRSNFIQWIVRMLYLDGRGNVTVWPQTERGALRELLPIPPSYVAYVPDGLFDYRVVISGREFSPESVLHFVLNPSSYYPWLGEGFTVNLTDVANNLKQAAATEKGFMSSKWKPSLIVKVDGLFDELGNPTSRRKVLDDYIRTNEAGEPWLISSEAMSVEQVKPLTLSDLALADFVKLDKQTVAAILGVPAFVLGVGEFKRDEWNNFVSTTIMPLAQIIEQELTRKLLLSPKLYWRFNIASLYSYDLRTTADVYSNLYVRGMVTGNEVRDKIGMEPLEGLDDLVILENYIPLAKIGEQLKLTQEV